MTDHIPEVRISKTARLLALLAEGPATTGEVAAELGWTTHSACAFLKNLHMSGRLKREPFPTGDARRRFLWSLA